MPKKENPLTLSQLAEYTQEVLLPAMDERFVLKKEFSELKDDVGVLKIDVSELKTDFKGLKDEFKEFKNENLSTHDEILKKLDILLTEKEVREYQGEKEKKLWALVIRALKNHEILSVKELEEISRLEIF